MTLATAPSNGLAAQLMQAWDSGQCLPRPMTLDSALDMPGAYALAEQLRQLRTARGERTVGWKIGFTNRSIWQRYNVHAPIWAPVWDSTLSLLEGATHSLSLAGLCQPRLEPEIVFGLAAVPQPGMDLQALCGCIAWVAHGFEVVHSHCADWRFEAPDTVADFGLHGRLLVGPRRPVAAWTVLADELSALRLELHCDGALKDRGQGSLVLDGPVQALAAWVQAMARDTPQWNVQAGDIVTTGTLTDAWPLQSGQHWHTQLSDARLTALHLHITA